MVNNKAELPFFKGVKLLDITKYDTPAYWNIHYMEFKLKYRYIDLYDKYAFWWANKQYMPFHDWLTDLVLSKLGSDNCQHFRVFQVSNPLSRFNILYQNSFYFQIETGLSGSYEGLIKRLYRNPYFVYVITPNMDIKKRYLKNLKQFHGRVLTLKEFYNLEFY